MTEKNLLDNRTLPNLAPTNPDEIALQSLCKQLVKSRLFRGFYLERRYVEHIKDYRDLVCLQKSENNLAKILRDIHDKLQLFYSYQNPNIWIGITSDSLTGIRKPPDALSIYLWVELQNLAFVEYWFSIKSIRFRDNEIIIKLKAVQPVEQEDISKWSLKNSFKSIGDKNKHTEDASADVSEDNPKAVSISDFILLLQQWWLSIKQTLYEFMAEDISKKNIKEVLRMLGLILVCILTATVEGLKFLGNFTLRFIYEINRFIHVATPIVLKIIDVLSKVLGGFYILLAMIWRDSVMTRNQRKEAYIEYNRPKYESIQYDVRQRNHGSIPTANRFEKNGQYERTK